MSRYRKPATCLNLLISRTRQPERCAADHLAGVVEVGRLVALRLVAPRGARIRYEPRIDLLPDVQGMKESAN